MSAEAFFDTNVLLYLLDADPHKAGVAERLLTEGGTISVQILNEFTNVARRKPALEWDELEETLGVLKAVCEVQPVTIATHERGLAIACRHKLSIYDALIVAAAAIAGATTLWSEDMQDGATLDGVTIRNPFRT